MAVPSLWRGTCWPDQRRKGRECPGECQCGCPAVSSGVAAGKAPWGGARRLPRGPTGGSPTCTASETEQITSAHTEQESGLKSSLQMHKSIFSINYPLLKKKKERQKETHGHQKLLVLAPQDEGTWPPEHAGQQPRSYKSRSSHALVGQTPLISALSITW